MASSLLPDVRSMLTREQKEGVAIRPPWLVLAWLLCCAVLLWLSRGELISLGFRDPDDAMRLQQVRDWIGGQAFHDVSQHRVTPPLGGPMHWSRIVDMPIAALILLLRPVLGTGLSEAVACSLVPLLLLGLLCWALFIAGRRVEGQAVGLLSAMLMLTTPTILVQFNPLRIDHHGWQILMAVIALGGAMDPRRVRGGVVAGLAFATWLQISSEGLPYAALFAAIFALRQWFAREEAGRFIAYATILGGTALPLLALLRGADVLFQQKCDGLSAAYIWPIAAFAAVTPIAFRLFGAEKAKGRCLAAAAGGGTAAVLFLFTGWPCLAGDPFAALGPVAYKLWYLKVMEGRPIWEQSMSMTGLILLPPVAGLAGSLLAAWASADPAVRTRWTVLSLLLAGAALVAILVMRALSVAHILALPGISWLMLHLFQRAQRQPKAAVRVIASSAVALLTPAALCALWIAVTAMVRGDSKESASVAEDCRARTTLAPLRSLPASLLFAPLDMGPDILIRTPHSVTGTAHHRNARGITAVVEGFTAPPDRARAIIARVNGGRVPDYLVTCSGLNEFKHYVKEHRGSLAAMLAQGRTPAWLKPVPLAGAKSLRVYRIMPE